MDPRYSTLFDSCLELCRGVVAGDRKQFARETTLKLTRALHSPEPLKALRGLEPELTESLGRPAAHALLKQARMLAPAKRHAPRWRVGKIPRIAVVTSRHTLDEAEQLYEALVDQGAETRIYSKSITVGRRIRHADEQALTNADYVVVVLSRPALNSNYVEYELDVIHWLEMADRRERLLPVIADDLSYEQLPPLVGPIRALSLPELGLDQAISEIGRRIDEDRYRR
jgi:hypothetical protein